MKSYDQPESLEASSQGNGQLLPGGGEFVGWGSLPYISEFDASGNLLFNAQFPTGWNSYPGLPAVGPGSQVVPGARLA